MCHHLIQYKPTNTQKYLKSGFTNDSVFALFPVKLFVSQLEKLLIDSKLLIQMKSLFNTHGSG